MKNRESKILGVNVAIPVPETDAEFNKAAKKENAACENGVNYVLYHSTFGEIRDVAIYGCDEEKDATGKVTSPAFDGIEKGLKIERKTKTVKKGDKDVELPDESEEEYVNRVRAVLVESKVAKDDATAASMVATYVNKAVALCPFDPSVHARKAGAGLKLAKMYITDATAMLTEKVAPTFEKVVDLKKVLAKIKSEIGKEFKVEGDLKDAAVLEKNITALGWVLKEWYAYRTKQAMANV